MPPKPAAFALLRLLFVLASLVGDAAAGLASRLAGSLALAAAALLSALAKITGLDGLDMLHCSLLLCIGFLYNIVSRSYIDVNISFYS